MAKALWVETYRPSTVSEYVFQNESQKKQVVTWIKEKSIPHVIFSGSAGTGKTSMAKMLIHEIGIEEFDVLEINASRTNSVDDVRDKITNFVSMIPFGPFKVVLLDECLHEDTLVVIMRNNIKMLLPIKDVNHSTDLVKSYNVDKGVVEWKSFELFNKGIQETLEIEFENGEVVICTPDHKWYVPDLNGNPTVVKASELKNHSHILSA